MGNRRICGEYIIYISQKCALSSRSETQGPRLSSPCCAPAEGVGSTKHVGTEDQLCVSLDGEFRV